MSDDQTGRENGEGQSSEEDVTYEEGQVVDQAPPQKGTPRRVPQGSGNSPESSETSPGNSAEACTSGNYSEDISPRSEPAHPANAPLPAASTPAHEPTGPSNPFKQGTKRFLVAQTNRR